MRPWKAESEIHESLRKKSELTVLQSFRSDLGNLISTLGRLRFDRTLTVI